MKTITTFGGFICTAFLVTTACGAGYVTGFEAPAFISGNLSGQDTWATISGPPDSARVLTASEIDAALTAAALTPGVTVHGGAQAVLVSMQAASSGSATIRVIPGMDTETRIVLDVWARPLNMGSAGSSIGTALGNVFLTMEDSSGDRAAAFRFGTTFGNTIDYGSGLGTPWQPTDILWDGNAWFHLTMDVDYAQKTFDFFIDGTKKNASPLPFYSSLADNFSQVRLFRGSNQAGMIVDDLTITIPEPAAVGCAIAGLIPLCVRRRRR